MPVSVRARTTATLAASAALAAALAAVLVAPTTPATAAEPVTIADVQGTGTTTPLAGRLVTTRGVVTAAYPTGGLRGVFLQTPGTGGDTDPARRTASDGLFVFGDAIASGARVGDHVEVTGTAGEYQGLTQVSLTSFRELDEPAAAVKPAAVAFPRTDAQREVLEGMLVRPRGPYTVTDTYDTGSFGSLVLAAGRTPLVQPTEVAAPGSARAAAVEADNAARRVTLDDGATLRFDRGDGADVPLPYLRPGAQVRVGAAVTFIEPVVLDQRFGAWNLQPTARVDGAAGRAGEPVRFERTRTARPERVGGRLRVASFNVLNYFPTTGEEYAAAAGTTCEYYRDRNGEPTTVESCADGGGPRGAADAASLRRQETKIVSAIDRLGADVVGLEEIENSVVFGQDRDAALATLTRALNRHAGRRVWDHVRSPAPDRLPPTTEQDVIRLAFVYRRDTARPIGPSRVLTGSTAFANAREPLAQTFAPRWGGRRDAVTVIANHFKSKGSGEGDDADQGDGQGGSNASRVRQAEALVGFADAVKRSARTDDVLLVGDFNAYSEEDPVRVLEAAGYVDLESRYRADETYVFDGLVGSLDHVFASPSAARQVTGLDVWNVNAVEPLAYEYSRFDANVTRLYDTSPYRSSDHDPVVVGYGRRR